MAKFIKIDEYYIGTVIDGEYLFMQIETLGEIYQKSSEDELLKAFNIEKHEIQINTCDELEEEFLLYQDKSELIALRIELIEKYNKL